MGEFSPVINRLIFGAILTVIMLIQPRDYSGLGLVRATALHLLCLSRSQWVLDSGSTYMRTRCGRRALNRETRNSASTAILQNTVPNFSHSTNFGQPSPREPLAADLLVNV